MEGFNLALWDFAALKGLVSLVSCHRSSLGSMFSGSSTRELSLCRDNGVSLIFGKYRVVPGSDDARCPLRRERIERDVAPALLVEHRTVMKSFNAR